MSILDTFLDTTERRRDQTAIIDGAGRPISFSDLASWSATLAGQWRAKGIGKGDRVLLAVPLGHALYASLAALWRLGAVAVFPEPAMGLAGLRHAARSTQPKAYLSSGMLSVLGYVVPELWPVARRLSPGIAPRVARDTPAILEPLDDDHPALISFTSGSTGVPKAIERTHGFLLSQHRAVATLLASVRTDQCDLIAFPVFVLVNLALGITSALPPWKVTRHDRADMDALAAFARTHRVTRLLAPPAICERMAGTPAAQCFDAIFTGGGPVFPDLLQRLLAENPRLAITAVYGSTEAEPIAHLDSSAITVSDWHAMKSGGGLLAGTPVPEIALRLIDGEIVVTGNHVNKSYMDPSRNAATKLDIDGEIWHRTGDAGRLDEQGRLWLLGRLDGRVGALYPFAIEAAARFWPGVRRAALSSTPSGAILAIEGNADRQPAWARAAAGLGVDRVVLLDRIPLDRRHRSKVDYTALAAAVTKAARH